MPTYDYLCKKCGHEFENFQPITAKPLKKCPACKKMQLQRLIGSGAGIIFKGTGFYQTDYPSESYKQGQKAAKPKTPDKKDKKTEANSETKTEKKTTEAPKANSKKFR